MPTYAYACTECGHHFEIVQSFSDDSLTVCPECSGRLRKLFNAVGVVFKGSGFYRNDSRAGAKSSGSSASGSAASGNGGSGSSGGASEASSSGGSGSSSSAKSASSGSSSSGSGSSGSGSSTSSAAS